MSFVDRAANPTQRNLCAIGQVVASLPDAEREGLEAMLADVEHWGHAGKDSIQEALKEEGCGTFGEKPIRAHRTKSCRCHRAKQ